MAGPISATTIFAGVSAAASVGGAAASAAGSAKGGQASGQASAYQAAVARNNAAMAEQQAVAVTQAGEVAAGTQSLKGANRVAGIKTAQAANGIDPNSGSAVNVRAGAREAGQLDAETVLSNAQVRAYGFRTQEASDEAQAQLDTLAGGQAVSAGNLKAAGGLLSAASSLPFKYLSTLGGGDTPSGGTAP